MMLTLIRETWGYEAVGGFAMGNGQYKGNGRYYVYWALLIQIVFTFPNQRTGPSGPSLFRVAKPGTLRVP